MGRAGATDTTPMGQHPKVVRLMEAAARLRKSREATLRLILVGELDGEQRDGLWYASESSIKKVLAK